MSQTRSPDGGLAPPARPSMADVGDAAGVSAQTVSRFFNGGYVSAATRIRIEEAISTLGYHHNRVARNLRISRTDTVGLVAIGPLNYGMASIVSGLSRAAHRAAKSLVITQLEVDAEDPRSHDEVHRAVDGLRSSQVDGIVIGTPFLGAGDLVDYLGPHMPVVTIAAHPYSSASSVNADSFEAAGLATRHLIELGHTQILHIAGPEDRFDAIERLRGYRAAMTEARLRPMAPAACEEWTAVQGWLRGQEADPDTFTAVFAADDQIALGFTAAMQAKGRHAPSDYSIVGVNDEPGSAFLHPALTTVRLDFELLGELALRTLLEHIRTGRPQDRVTVAPSLQVRRSTASASGD